MHHSAALRRNNKEYQLEKSISSHDQGDSWHPKQHKNPKRITATKKKQRQFNNGARKSAHDFDVFGADYVDFGAVIGQNGAFSWHANYSPE